MKNTARACLQLALACWLLAGGPAKASERLLVTLAADRHLVVLQDGSERDRIEVGIAPWSVVVHENTAYVSTAEGLAVVDLINNQRRALAPYQYAAGAPAYGEYRPGGMGLAVTPDGRYVYVGVYTGSRTSRLEVFDVAQGKFVQGYSVGTRPFDVQVSPDGRWVASIDHDSYSVTAVDTHTRQLRRFDIAPLGYAAFDKPHYAIFDANNRLYLPIQGQVLAILDLETGELRTRPLTAETHQHGVAWRSNGRELLILGTGPAGGARNPPSLTLLDVATGAERVLPLTREHEQILVTRDGQKAWLSGGQSFTGGWNGLTQVDLSTGELRRVTLEGQPLGLAWAP